MKLSVNIVNNIRSINISIKLSVYESVGECSDDNVY